MMHNMRVNKVNVRKKKKKSRAWIPHKTHLAQWHLLIGNVQRNRGNKGISRKS